MKRRTRRVLFWTAVLLFALLSWVVVKYAQGYVYDWSTHMFVRTGAVAVTVNTSATFVIDGAPIGTTSLIGNTAGKSGLKPGTYTIQLTRDGYSPWRKVVMVQEGLLTDFPHAMILPTDDDSLVGLEREASQSFASARTLRNATVTKKSVLPAVQIGDFLLRGKQLLDMRTASSSLVADGVLGAAMADNTSRILWWTQNELWVMWLTNTNNQPYHSENEREKIIRFAMPIVRAAWFRDESHIVVDFGSGPYRVIETDTRGGVNIIRI